MLTRWGVNFWFAVVQHRPCLAMIPRACDVVGVDIKGADVKQAKGCPLVGLGQIAGEQNTGKEEGFEMLHELTIPLTKLARALQYLCI